MLDTDPKECSRGAERVRLRRALALLGATLVLPGSAQLVCGNKAVGRAALRVLALVVVVGVGGLIYLGGDGLVAVGLDPFWLTFIEVAIAVLAACWLALFVDAWRLGRPPSLRRQHRALPAALSLALMAGVAVPLGYGAYLVDLQRRLIQDEFVAGSTGELYKGRLNILLLGGDGGLNRRGIRTDSISLASIDMATGKTVMFSLPRNLQYAPFPPGTLMAKRFPNGFPEFFFGIYTWAQENRQLFGKINDPGALAVEQAVAQTLGIPVHYYALVNLSGFQKVIDALGGITLNVDRRLPIGGGENQVTGKQNPILGYIEPGLQKLNGYRALWYARSRAGNANGDYDRMDRQRCVLGGILREADPLNVLLNYRRLVKSFPGVIATDLTQGALKDLVAVAPKAKGGASMASVTFNNRVIDPALPNVQLIRDRVQAAIAKSEAIQAPTPKPTATAKATKKPTTKKPKPTASPKPKAAAPGESVELKDTCQYS
ncbi:MAG: LCP family protein [Sporichthyaceae bacterium]